VLVVDDDADIRDAVREVLEEAGYTTLEASHGREALELLQRAEVKPRLLLLDLMMPTMDGWQLRARLLEDPALATLPIVIMTAHAGVLRAVASAQPPTPVLSKPIDVDRLLELVATYCKEEPPGVH
jgi:CheY-like chemotaxis protein